MELQLSCLDYETLELEIKKFINSKKEQQAIREAYDYAFAKHQGQTRKNGDPYIIHCLSTAYNLALWRLDPASLKAGLLHDVLEDTPTTLEELSGEFGMEIANLVLAVTKVSHFAKEKRNEIKANYLRKLYLSLAYDIRVIIIKLADRLHNMRTITYLNPEKQAIIAKETLEVYASIAHRLGMRHVKSELEDRSFEILHPREYKKIANLVSVDREVREKMVEQAMSELLKVLSLHKEMKFTIYGRSKNLYSIYRKMYYFGKDFHDINDILAIRIITQSIDNCYAILGYIHQRFTPVPGRFKDYVASPKNNMYQSLHTAIIFNNEIYEIQIRTEDMELFAEEGAAAHWRYKEGNKVNPKKKQQEIDEKLNIFKEIFELDFINQDSSDINYHKVLRDEQGSEGVENDIKQDIFSELIYILTPNGKVITLPLGSTILDFAYKVHSEIGDSAMGGRVNGVFATINTVLKSGDIVEIKTGKTAHPTREWLLIAKTAFAQHKIKRYLNKQEELVSQQAKIKETEDKKKIEQIKEKIDQYILNSATQWKVVGSRIFGQRLKKLKYNTPSEFYLAIANNVFSIEEAVRNVYYSDSTSFKELTLTKTVAATSLSSDFEVLIDSYPSIKNQLAQCCLPIPDESIVGYITKGQGVRVHRSVCPNIQAVDKQERCVSAQWNPNINPSKTFNTALDIFHNDRPVLVADILTILGHLKAPITSIEANAQQHIAGQGHIKISIKLTNLDKLVQVVSSLRKIPGVIEISRMIM